MNAGMQLSTCNETDRLAQSHRTEETQWYC